MRWNILIIMLLIVSITQPKPPFCCFIWNVFPTEFIDGESNWIEMSSRDFKGLRNRKMLMKTIPNFKQKFEAWLALKRYWSNYYGSTLWFNYYLKYYQLLSSMTTFSSMIWRGIELVISEKWVDAMATKPALVSNIFEPTHLSIFLGRRHSTLKTSG